MVGLCVVPTAWVPVMAHLSVHVDGSHGMLFIHVHHIHTLEAQELYIACIVCTSGHCLARCHEKVQAYTAFGKTELTC